MKKALFILLIVPIFGMAQNAHTTKLEMVQGIHFENGLSWSEIQAKAKSENKFIFMDCFATWCAPCKYMSEHVFTDTSLAKYMNDHFINVAIQMDRTANDLPDIRDWYIVADGIVKKYNINSYPTYLFFSPDGLATHRVVGARSAEDLISKAKDASDPSKQYFTLIGNYTKHFDDSSFLANAITAALLADDFNNTDNIGDAYLKCIKNVYSADNLKLICSLVQSSHSASFKFLISHTSIIDSILKKSNITERIICKVFSKEALSPVFAEKNARIEWRKIIDEWKLKYPLLSESAISSMYIEFEYQIWRKQLRSLYEKNAEPADWAAIRVEMKGLYPDFDSDTLISIEMPKYYAYKKLWQECEKAVLACMDKYENKINPTEINNFCWEYSFLHSNNRDLLLRAAQWARKIVPDSSDTVHYYAASSFASIDTYANLLYKVGKRDMAIFWEEEALRIAMRYHVESTQVSFKKTLERMKNGLSTWEGRDPKFEEYQ